MKWISIKEKLPPLNEWVILLDSERGKFSSPPAGVGRRYKFDEESDGRVEQDGNDPNDPEESFYSCCFTPSHWMPLPQNPENNEKVLKLENLIQSITDEELGPLSMEEACSRIRDVLVELLEMAKEGKMNER